MYELSIAAKYLMPKWRQLSVSIISLISIFVITIVVWLIVVFFSVTNGLTNGWLDKLTALTAPVRITPTKEYYHSYYYLVDGISSDSDYSLKSIGEKRIASETDPYVDTMDEEIPTSWRKPDRLADGTLKDPVKLAFQAIEQLPDIKGIAASEHETSIGNLHLRLSRPQKNEIPSPRTKELPQGYITQASFIGSLDPLNPSLTKTIISPTMPDLSNVLSNLTFENERGGNIDISNPDSLNKEAFKDRLKAFFSHVSIEQLKTADAGWLLPLELLPAKASWNVIALLKGEKIIRLILPKENSDLSPWLKRKNLGEYNLKAGKLEIDGGHYSLSFADHSETKFKTLPPLVAPEGMMISAELISNSLVTAKNSSDLLFHAKFSIQGIPFAGVIRYNNLEIARAKISTKLSEAPEQMPFWAYSLPASEHKLSFNLPAQPAFGEGILLPRSFRDSGALIGDTGYISYQAPSPSGIHEQQTPVFIAGFYDPGIIPIGGKYVLANQHVITQIRASYNQEDNPAGNGINVRFDDREKADKVKSELLKKFDDMGISDYWKIETYREFEFTRDVIQQLQSDKHLFSLLAALIIIVACSNIISMLIILVNDKKTEIGILRSMGASSLSMAAIFGSCGIIMGVTGSVAGILAAMLTLKNLQPLVNFISWIQGYEMFNPLFYGENLPTDLSFETLTFVIATTGAISLIAGMIPAIKASLLKPSAILKAE
ncbi:MAG: FtsX-like permease family protein [Parachlamydiaceae bacterium]|nr:FtsX-like permease family protein [Parachlamydiaceae bacterium]